MRGWRVPGRWQQSSAGAAGHPRGLAAGCGQGAGGMCPSVRPSVPGGFGAPQAPLRSCSHPPSASFHKASRGGGGEDESGLQAPGDRTGGEGGTWWGFVAGQPPP